MKRFKARSIDSAIRSLNAEFKKIEGDISKGLKLGLLHISGEAVDNAPIEYGLLRNSRFTDVDKTRGSISGRVGFQAHYAPFVHEMPMVRPGAPRAGAGPDGKPRKGVYWQGGGNKFLERAITDNKDSVLRLIRLHAKR